jgi:acetate/butyrate---CoA ligase
VTLQDDVDCSDEAALAHDIIRFCRERMPGYWVARGVRAASKGGDRQDQEA